MKKVLNIFLIVLISSLAMSCFFDDDSELAKEDISKITLSSKFKELTFSAMESPDFGVKIEQSGENNELHYEWSYGNRNPNSSGYPISQERTIISTDSLLTYQFPYLGKYTLKLIVDNGEHANYMYFDLNISAGYDEGLAIITKEESGKGHMAFYKTLTEHEISEGAEEKIISDFYKDLEFNNPTSILSPKDKAIFITDESGKIFKFDQQTMALDMICRSPELNGAYLTTMSSYFYSSLQDKLGCYCFTNDNRVYRFNAGIGKLETLTTNKYEIFSYEDIDAESIIKSNSRYQHYINYTKSTITGTYGSEGYFKDFSNDYKLLSVGYPYNDSNNYLYIIAQNTDDPTKYSVIKEYCKLNRSGSVKEYSLLDELTVNNSTKFINSDEYDDYLLYIYKNKIYRWEYKIKAIPEVGNHINLDLPDDEEIVKICFNGDRDGTKLFVITYNPSKAGELKGSIYIYDADTYERIKVFENSIHRAVDAIYKRV